MTDYTTYKQQLVELLGEFDVEWKRDIADEILSSEVIRSITRDAIATGQAESKREILALRSRLATETGDSPFDAEGQYDAPVPAQLDKALDIEALTYTQTREAMAIGWDEGYTQGVNDGRIAAEWLADAQPARENPHRASTLDRLQVCPQCGSAEKRTTQGRCSDGGSGVPMHEWHITRRAH